MNFLKPEEKKELESSIKNRSKRSLDLVEEYYKTKNIASIKSAILNMFKKKSFEKQSTNPNNSTFNSVDSGNMNSKEIKEVKLFGAGGASANAGSNNEITNINAKILTKLEKKDSKNFSSTLQNAYTSLDKLLEDLEKSGKISSHKHRYIYQRYKSNDDILLSVWECYTHNSNLPELIENLKIFSTNTNIRRPSGIITNGKTPALVSQKKNEIIDFLKGKENKEKDEIKNKQLHIIDILSQENMLDRKSAPLITQMIYKENHLLISAFEIFSVTKDHWEFCDTLNIITDIYNNEGGKKNIAIPDSKDFKLTQIFETFIRKSKFTEKEKDILRKKLVAKEDFMMSSLEFYETSGDDEELMDTLIILLKK